MSKEKPKRQVTGVSLEVRVIKYLDEVAAKEDRTRSYMLNRLVHEHAKRKGKTLR